MSSQSIGFTSEWFQPTPHSWPRSRAASSLWNTMRYIALLSRAERCKYNANLRGLGDRSGGARNRKKAGALEPCGEWLPGEGAYPLPWTISGQLISRDNTSFAFDIRFDFSNLMSLLPSGFQLQETCCYLAKANTC